MPNWVETKVEISGDPHTLDRLATQVSRPYNTEGYDFMTNEVKHFEQTGAFLLWNIVAPTDLDAYHKRAETAERIAKQNKATKKQENTDPVAIKEAIAEVVDTLNKAVTDVNVLDVADEFYKNMSVENDWYFWNLRNWGTKWEITDARVEREPNKLTYRFATAWSPPAEALTRLAEQYPEVIITLKCHDEGDMFAAELHWSDGEMSFESDLAITHGLLEELYGYCHGCDGDDEVQAHYGCDKWKAVK